MDQQQYFTYSRRQSLKSAADSWASAQGINWDIAACWHLPVCDIGSDIDDVEIRVGKKLRRYFNTLDRLIFKAKHKRGFRVRRFITLEHAAGVGWHVHGVLETPLHSDQATLIDQVKQTWIDCVAYDKIGLPYTKLAWCEPVADRYQQYTTKLSFGPLHRAKGTIDLQNTYFGEFPN